MAFFNEFPHTRTYDSDLGWLIWAMKKLISDWDNFSNLNSIKFADPILWTIDRNYEPAMIVLDDDGNGYISRKAVPAGVPLSNDEYWTQIFNFGDITETLRDNIAYNAQESATAPIQLLENQLVWWNGQLYRVLYNIAAGTAFIPDTNIKKVTVDDEIKRVQEVVKDAVIEELQPTITDIELTLEDHAERLTIIQNALHVEPYVNVVENGVDNTGAETVSDAIDRVIKDYPQHVLFFPDGVYKVNRSIIIDGDLDKRVTIRLSDQAIIQATDDFTGDYVIDFYYKGTDAPINMGDDDHNIHGLIGGFVNGNDIANGVHIGKVHDTIIMNCEIYKCTDYCIRIDPPFDYNSADAFIFNVTLAGTPNRTCGLYVNSADNDVIKVRTWDTKYGVIIRTINNSFQNLHLLMSGYNGFGSDNYDESVGVWFQNGCYNNHFDNLYCDNFACGIKTDSGTGFNTIGRYFCWYYDTIGSVHHCFDIADNWRFNVAQFQYHFTANTTDGMLVNMQSFSVANLRDGVNSSGLLDSHLRSEGSIANMTDNWWRDLGWYMPWGTATRYTIGNSGQAVNSYRLIAVVRGSNEVYTMAINSYHHSAVISFRCDPNGPQIQLCGVQRWLVRNQFQLVFVPLGTAFGTTMYAIYLHPTGGSGSAWNGISFPNLAPEQMAMFMLRNMQANNPAFRDQTSLDNIAGSITITTT